MIIPLKVNEEEGWTISDEHSSTSYGQFVLLKDGEPSEFPEGVNYVGANRITPVHDRLLAQFLLTYPGLTEIKKLVIKQ